MIETVPGGRSGGKPSLYPGGPPRRLCLFPAARHARPLRGCGRWEAQESGKPTLTAFRVPGLPARSRVRLALVASIVVALSHFDPMKPLSTSLLPIPYWLWTDSVLFPGPSRANTGLPTVRHDVQRTLSLSGSSAFAGFPLLSSRVRLAQRRSEPRGPGSRLTRQLAKGSLPWIARLEISRRSFVTAAGTTALAFGMPAIVPARAVGREGKAAASERLTLGFIGMGTQNRGHLGRFLGQTDVQVVAVCDVDTTRREHAKETVEETYADGRPRAAVQGLRGLQRLPRAAGPRRHRRGRDRHARPLARHPASSRRARPARTSTARSRCR